MLQGLLEWAAPVSFLDVPRQFRYYLRILLSFYAIALIS